MTYIQSNEERTMPHHFDACCAMYGAIDLGNPYRLTTFDEVKSGKFDNLIKNNLFMGSVEFMTEVFDRVNKSPKLPRNSNNPFVFMTLGEARENVKYGNRIFIKPVQLKLFTGMVLDNSGYNCLAGIPDDTTVMVYDVFEEDILSEWRIYVNRYEIEDARNYAGSPLLTPDYKMIQKEIDENREQGFPCAYTIDVAKFETLPDTIIEFNDMWAIGNYGVPNYRYWHMLRNRYKEIMQGH